jgi:hypothetical protein
MDQPELLQPEHLPSRLHWEQLFRFLPGWPEQRAHRHGRNPVSRSSILKGLVLQRLLRLRFLRSLHSLLLDHPPVLAACGFDPYQAPPSLERFSAFLADTPPEQLAALRISLVKDLINDKIIKARHVGLDSCPVASWVRENNLKTSLAHARFDKTKYPKGDPDARLGVRIHFPQPNKKKVVYFWGYRNHALVDLESELPIWEITEPNSVHELVVAIPLLKNAVDSLGLKPASVCGDSEYDAETVLRYILGDLQAQAVIPRQVRSAQDSSGFQRKGDAVICPGGLKMYRKGKMTTKGVTRIQFCCPFYYGGSKPDMLMCPVDHPKFSTQKGCGYLWRITEDLRDQIPYGTTHFKLQYNRRTAVERAFSRLLAITLEEPSVRGLASIRNHCTISHIAVLLVAKAAHEFDSDDKIRFVRTFVPRFL